MSMETRSVTDGLPIVSELESSNILQPSTAPLTSSATPTTKVMHPLVAWLQKHFSRKVVNPSNAASSEMLNASSDILNSLTTALQAIQSKTPAANSHQIEPTKVLQFTAPATTTAIPSSAPTNTITPSPTDLKPKNRK